MRASKAGLAAIVLAAWAAPNAPAVELQADTLAAWNAYLKKADVRMQERFCGRRSYLWMDQSAERAARINRGETVVAPVAGSGMEPVPHGLVHEWIGGIFIPGATIESVWAVVHDYDHYQQIYRPVVTSSKMVTRADANQEFQMVWQRKILFVNAAVQGHYQAHDVMIDSHRGYSVAEAVEIREIESYGHAEERLLPAGTGNGFIWRIRSVARFEERDGGVYLEVEVAALTRDIPSSLGWVAKPVVNRLSINSLTTTLRQTRDAVTASRGGREIVAACPNSGGCAGQKTGGE